jgi:hypothetical protein
MENVNPNRANASDLQVNDFNPNQMHHSKRLELLVRWIPVCQDIANESGREPPDADRLRQMILSAHQTMCLLTQVSLEFPDAVTQDRIINQFLIDCFSEYE